MMNTYWMNKSKRSHATNVFCNHEFIRVKQLQMNYSKDSSFDWEYWVSKTTNSPSEKQSESSLFSNLLNTISPNQQKQRVEEQEDFTLQQEYNEEEEQNIDDEEIDVEASIEDLKAELKRRDPLSIEDKLNEIIRLTTGTDPDVVEKEKLRRALNLQDADSQLKLNIEEEVNRYFEALSPEEFDKLFFEAQTENSYLKELKQKMLDLQDKLEGGDRTTAQLLHKLEPDTISMTSSEEYRQLINSLLDNTLSIENLKDSVREAKSDYLRKSAKERRLELLTTSYKFYTQQRDLNFEKQRNEQTFAELLKKYDALKKFSPDVYKQQIKELYSKTLPLGVVDKVLDRIVAGDSIPEVKRFFDSLSHPILSKPEYEHDEYAEFRESFQQKIDEQQYQVLMLQGVKSGRKGPTPLIFSVPRHDEKLFRSMVELESYDADQVDYSFDQIFLDYMAIDKIEGWRQKVRMGHKRARTYLPKRAVDKRMERTAKRRFNMVRLENTIRAFTWVRKFKPRFFA